MLEPQSRAALTEQLRPPSGYELSHAVGTTFTLDLSTALSVPLSFASHRLADNQDTLGVLDSIRRAADRVDIFAQAGEISMGSRSDLVAFLEPMIHPVSLRSGLFHPKVWFLEYRAGTEAVYRFLCASRNLTADRSWDIVVRLDGAPAREGSKRETAATNRPLVNLLRRLPDIGVHPLSTERRGRIEELAERWRGVEWELPNRMRSVAFHVFGVAPGAAPNLQGKRALIVSPFLSDDGLRALRAGVRAETQLLSRAESLDRLHPDSLDSRLSTYVLDEAAAYSADEEPAGEGAGMLPRRDRLSGLHAKALVIDRLDGAHVFLGSANATSAGWRSNVEVMVEFVGSITSVGVQATLDALGDLKEEYTTDGGGEPDENEEAERRLESLVRQLAGTRFSVRVLPEDSYGLRVCVDASAASTIRRSDEAVSFRWHLLTRSDLGSDVFSPLEADAPTLRQVPLTEITPFIVLVARDARGNERRTIVVARLLDDVETRRDAIIARHLTDRESFVRLLTLLLELSGAHWLASEGGSENAGFFGSPDAGSNGAGLFEALVRAVGEGHHGLADARRIIDYVRAHDDHDVLPLGFEELWNQIWSAHLELTGGGE